MATFSRTLEHTLRRALSLATDHSHEYVTLEHLLLSLVDDDDASGVMHACKVDLDKLRRRTSKRISRTNSMRCVVNNREHEEPRPTAGFQRVLQRAMLHVDSSGGREVTGANVLVAIFSRTRKPRRLFPARAGHDAL
jgi:ATP-dependent Clp protease ATP-binding subunit ClpA